MTDGIKLGNNDRQNQSQVSAKLSYPFQFPIRTCILGQFSQRTFMECERHKVQTSALANNSRSISSIVLASSLANSSSDTIRHLRIAKNLSQLLMVPIIIIVILMTTAMHCTSPVECPYPSPSAVPFRKCTVLGCGLLGSSAHYWCCALRNTRG